MAFNSKGDPLTLKIRRVTPLLTETQLAFFKTKCLVIENSGCLIWNGELNRKKYGLFEVDGEKYFAHRLAWRVATNREIPEGMWIVQKCGSNRCVNPNHLIVSTATEQMELIKETKELKGNKRPWVTKVSANDLVYFTNVSYRYSKKR